MSCLRTQNQNFKKLKGSKNLKKCINFEQSKNLFGFWRSMMLHGVPFIIRICLLRKHWRTWIQCRLFADSLPIKPFNLADPFRASKIGLYSVKCLRCSLPVRRLLTQQEAQNCTSNGSLLFFRAQAPGLAFIRRALSLCKAISLFPYLWSGLSPVESNTNSSGRGNCFQRLTIVEWFFVRQTP